MPYPRLCFLMTDNLLAGKLSILSCYNNIITVRKSHCEYSNVIKRSQGILKGITFIKMKDLDISFQRRNFSTWNTHNKVDDYNKMGKSALFCTFDMMLERPRIMSEHLFKWADKFTDSHRSSECCNGHRF